MELDPRGQRFAAALTSIVLIVVLATGWSWLALAQALVFALTAAEPRRGPYSFIYRALVLPRIGPPPSASRPRRYVSPRWSGSCSSPWRRSGTCPA